MGIGNYPAGQTLAGFDGQELREPLTQTVPSALEFDGTTKDYKTDASGRLVAAHPVDAKVFFLVRTATNSIRSSTSVGQSIGALPYIDQQRIRAQIEDNIRNLLSGMVAARQITLLDIEIDTAIRGRIQFRVNYQNLITKRRQSAFSG